MQLPSELQWLEWVVGSDWPEGDEDALWRLAEAWNQAAIDLMRVIQDGDRSAEQAAIAMDGVAAEKFKAHWERYTTGDTAYFAKLAEQCEKISKLCDSTATEIEYAKYQFILALIILAIQIAYMLAMAAATFGASTAGIPVATAATQLTVRVIAQRLLTSILMGAGMNVGMDLLVQTVQIAEGHRDGYDLAKTGQAALDGAISGAIGGGLGLGAGKFAPNFAKSFVGDTLVQGAAGAVSAVTTAAVHGEDITLESVAKGAVSGGIGGAVDHGTEAAKGHGPGLAPSSDETPSFKVDGDPPPSGPGGPTPSPYGDSASSPTHGDSASSPTHGDSGSTPTHGDSSSTPHPQSGGTSTTSEPTSSSTHNPASTISTPDAAPSHPTSNQGTPHGGGDSTPTVDHGSTSRPSSGDSVGGTPPATHSDTSTQASSGGGNRYSQALNLDGPPATDHGVPSQPAEAPASHASGSSPASLSDPGPGPQSGGAVPNAEPQGTRLSSVDTAAPPDQVTSSPSGPSAVTPQGSQAVPADSVPGQTGVGGPMATGTVPGAAGPVTSPAGAAGAGSASSAGTSTSASPSSRVDRAGGGQSRAGAWGYEPGSDSWRSRGESVPAPSTGRPESQPTHSGSDPTRTEPDTTHGDRDNTAPEPDTTRTHDGTQDASHPNSEDRSLGDSTRQDDTPSGTDRADPPPPVRLSDGSEYAVQYGPESTPARPPFENRISDVVNERTFPPDGPHDTRTPAQRFMDLKNTNADLLTPEQRTAVAEVRNHETVHDGDVMAKVLTFSAAESYVTNGNFHETVIGFVAKFDDVRPLDTPAAQFEGLGLDYGPASPFRADQDHYYSIRWQAEDASQYTPAYSSDMADAPGVDPHRSQPIGTDPGEMQYSPYTGNGYTLSEQHATPEFRTDGGRDGQFGPVALPPGAEIWRVNADGTQSPVAVYQNGQWSHVQGADLSDLGGTPAGTPDPSTTTAGDGGGTSTRTDPGSDGRSAPSDKTGSVDESPKGEEPRPGDKPNEEPHDPNEEPHGPEEPQPNEEPQDRPDDQNDKPDDQDDASEPTNEPDDSPDQGPEDQGGPEYVDDAQALDLVRQTVRETPSGYSFYPEGDEIQQFANAVPVREGVVNLDLHGSEAGFHINGQMMTGEQFARAIRQLEAEGAINLDGRQIRLSSCDVARGDNSPAARFARESGLSVTAPTAHVWTSLAGNEIVSSPQLHNGRWVPGQPPDGGWRTFTPDGVDTTAHPTGGSGFPDTTPDSRTPAPERATGPPEVFQPRAVDWEHTYAEGDQGLQSTEQRDRYGRPMYQTGDERLHSLGDGYGSHRNNAGQLIDTETSKYTDDNNRPNLEGMVRAEEAGDTRTVYAHDGDGQPIDPDLYHQLQETISERNDIVERRQNLWEHDIAPILDALNEHEVDVSKINQASSQTKFNALLDAVRFHLTPQQLDTFVTATGEFTNAARDLRLASERLGTLGGTILTAQEFEGAIRLSGGDLTPGTSGNFDRVLLLPGDPPELVVVEEKGAGATLGARLTDDPIDPNAQVHYSEQGSTDYLRDLLQRDNKLGPYFAEHPEHRQLVERAIREGTIRYLLSRTTEDGRVLVTDFVVDETRLNRGGINLVGGGSN